MKVQFLKDTSKAIIPKYNNTIVVYREGYNLPTINAEYLEFEKYKASYINYNPDVIVLIGTNRIMTPANRTELVFEYLQTMTSHIDKYSIDTSPFIGEPWRAWIHYSIAYGSWLGVNYSYAIETDWKHWFYRNKDNCWLQGAEKLGTYSDIEQIFHLVNFYDADSNLLDYYNIIKNEAFSLYDTPKQIMLWMMKQLNKYLSIDYTFDSYLKKQNYMLPNLNIYNFIYEENLRRMEIYNELIK